MVAGAIAPALAQNAKDPLGIEEVLERHHGIISTAMTAIGKRNSWKYVLAKVARRSSRLTAACPAKPSSRAIRQQQRHRGRLFSLGSNEMQVDPMQRDLELYKPVQFRLPRTPVEMIAPPGD